MTSALSTAAPIAPVRRPHLAPVPDCEPPFDRCDRHPPVPPRRRTAPAVVLPAPTQPDGSPPDIDRAQVPPSAGCPPVDHAARAVSRALVEALCGLRTVRQLRTFCGPSVQAALGDRVRHGGETPRLLSVRVSEPADGAAEVTAVFRRGPRAAAMAFRMQAVGGRWQVTELQLG